MRQELVNRHTLSSIIYHRPAKGLSMKGRKLRQTITVYDARDSACAGEDSARRVDVIQRRASGIRRVERRHFGKDSLEGVVGGKAQEHD